MDIKMDLGKLRRVEILGIYFELYLRFSIQFNPDYPTNNPTLHTDLYRRMIKQL